MTTIHKLKTKTAEVISTTEFDDATINAINNLFLELQMANIQIKRESLDEITHEDGEYFEDKLILEVKNI